jgi:hypothetical protein
MTSPTFFLLVDAIPHALAHDVWAAGGLPGFDEPRPTVSVFPSLTAVAVPALLRGIFDEVPAGYEVRYYDPAHGEIRGSFGDAASEAAMAPFRTRPHGLLGHTAVYLLRRGLAYAQIRWITHRFQEEGGPWLGYLSATDGVAHFSGRSGLERSLRDIAHALDAARREYERRHGELPGVVLCSDHGMRFGAVEHLAAHQLEDLLAGAGYRVGKPVPDGVTLVPYGEVGAGVVHTSAECAPGVAEVVAGAPGVDLAIAHQDDGCLVFGLRETLERAQVRWRDGAYRYECLDGDPLGYAPVWEALADAGALQQGWAPDRALFLATWRHAYPDALARLRRGLEDLVRYPAAVLFSMHDAWTFGPTLTHVGATVMGGLVGNHGALTGTQSLGFAAVTGDGADPWPGRQRVLTPESRRQWAGSRSKASATNARKRRSPTIAPGTSSARASSSASWERPAMWSA